MKPPLSGRRDAARRLAGDLRRRLGMPDAGPPPPQEAPAPPMDPEQAAHRIDAARARLRSTIAAPDDDAELPPPRRRRP
jgi:hypothetical protein